MPDLTDRAIEVQKFLFPERKWRVFLRDQCEPPMSCRIISAFSLGEIQAELVRKCSTKHLCLKMLIAQKQSFSQIHSVFSQRLTGLFLSSLLTQEWVCSTAIELKTNCLAVLFSHRRRVWFGRFFLFQVFNQRLCSRAPHLVCSICRLNSRHRGWRSGGCPCSGITGFSSQLTFTFLLCSKVSYEETTFWASLLLPNTKAACLGANWSWKADNPFVLCT